MVLSFRLKKSPSVGITFCLRLTTASNSLSYDISDPKATACYKLMHLLPYKLANLEIAALLKSKSKAISFSF